MDTNLPRPALPRPEPATGYTSLPNAVLHLGLSARELQLVVQLLAIRWTPETEIRPRLKTLAERMSCSVRTVQRACDSLVLRGLLTVEARYRDDGGRASNVYRLGWVLTTVVTADGCHDVASPRHERLAPTTRMERQETAPRYQDNRRGRQNHVYRPPTDPDAWTQTRTGTIQRR